MKLIVILLFLITNLTACGQSNTNEIKTTENWKILTEKNYSINYPNKWELNKSGQMGTNFILFSPLSSENDQFKENVNLLIQNLKGHNLDLNKYVKLSESQIKTMMTDGNILESNRISAETIDFHKLIYTGKQGVYNLKFEQYFWVVNDSAYVLTLTCEKNEFDNYKALGEKILDSFKLNNN